MSTKQSTPPPTRRTWAVRKSRYFGWYVVEDMADARPAAYLGPNGLSFTARWYDTPEEAQAAIDAWNARQNPANRAELTTLSELQRLKAALARIGWKWNGHELFREGD